MITVIIVVWGLGPVGLCGVWVDEMGPRTTLVEPLLLPAGPVKGDGGGRGSGEAGHGRTMAGALLYNDQHGVHGAHLLPYAGHQLHRYLTHVLHAFSDPPARVK